MPSTITLKATGLNTSPNQLELPEGSLIEAKNVLIRRDNIIEPMRGFKLFGSSMGSPTDTAKTLFEYRERIFRHYGNILEFQNGLQNDGTANFDAFVETVDETSSGLRIKKIESNGNLYFTTSEGIKKISAVDGDGIENASIIAAGGIKAVDMRATLKISDGDQAAFLPQDSTVAYRVAWGTKDVNSNLVTGTPSQREEIYNPLNVLILRDFHRLLRALDGVSNFSTVSILSDANYVDTLKLPLTATAVETQTNLLSLAAKIDEDLLIAQNTVTTAPLNIDDTAAVAQVETITTVADSAGSLNNKYFYLNAADGTSYYVWINVNSAGTDPLVTGKTGIQVSIATGTLAPDVATAVSNAINAAAATKFTATVLGSTVTVTQDVAGVVAAMTDISTGFTFGTTTAGTAGLSHAISSGVYTITFSAGNPTDYWSVGSKVNLTGFTPTTGTLDGIQTISALNATTISINTEAVGPVAVAANANIQSGIFRSIVEPAIPGLPATNAELVDLQDYLQTMITALQDITTTGTPPMVAAAARTEWLDPIDITTTGYVGIQITIPQGVTSNHFYQLYRSSISTATGASTLDDLVPSDELQLVYEAYPTSAEIAAGTVLFDDVTPDEFRGANLYTNPATGEGALQANDLPPFAKDINRFKNVVFYANTRTRHRLQLNLLGVQTMITDFNNGIIPKLSIISGDAYNTYTFVKGEYETTEIVCNGAATLANTGTADSFNLYSAKDERAYYVWYKIGTAVDPAPAGKIGIQVELTGAETDSVVATKTAAAIASYPWDFAASASTNVITIIVTAYGDTTNTSDAGTGFTFTTTDAGVGENAATKQILLSDQTSVALAVDQTARSLIRVINQNSDEGVYAFYLSGNNDVPGKIFLESKSVTDGAFYILGNNAVTGAAFNPDISSDFTITGISTGAAPTVTTSTPHGLVNGQTVVLGQTNSTPVIDNVYSIYEVTSTTFKIDVNDPVTVAGTTGLLISTANSTASENEDKKNRVYYSKLSQPESVPIVNFFDVGDSDKQILRIFPLRDSLFIFKEEGLYRVSGETAPFNLALFDSSCQLSAPDTVDVNNNLIYCLTTQGVMTVSEGGVNIISRPIDNIILRIPVFTNYKTLSFGMGYESDNSYTLWTVQRSTDECATIGFRYSNLTNTWTTVDREVTCGFVNPVDDKSYHGAGDTNYIEQERKDFDRTDYAGRELEYELLQNNYFDDQMIFTTVTDVTVGDVFVQTQQLTCYEYNMLLKKLDIDPGVTDADYHSLLESSGGDSLRLKLEALTAKLDSDAGAADNDYTARIASYNGSITGITTANPCVITTAAPHNLLTGRNITISGTDSTPNIDGTWEVTVLSPTTFSIPTEIDTSGTTGIWTTANSTFDDLAGCFNIIVNKLNLDTGVSFSNYREIDTETTMEAIVTDVNRNQKRVTFNISLDFVVGPLTVYKAIDSAFTYGPNTFGNSISFKHFRDATMMFESKAFTSAKMQFSTDLLPQLISQEFNGDGNGIFGYQTLGTGFFGGGSSGAPFRTYVPRQCQRCRYLTVRFNHTTARESYKIFGTTLTGEDTQSTRSYR